MGSTEKFSPAGHTVRLHLSCRSFRVLCVERLSAGNATDTILKLWSTFNEESILDRGSSFRFVALLDLRVDIRVLDTN
jgi:hypothetical protein